MSAQSALSVKEPRLEALRKKHHVLSDRIEEAYRSPSITDFQLRQLKKQKLSLKEKMQEIRESGRASA